jgi:hypothetical protein
MGLSNAKCRDDRQQRYRNDLRPNGQPFSWDS